MYNVNFLPQLESSEEYIFRGQFNSSEPFRIIPCEANEAGEFVPVKGLEKKTD